MFYYVQCITIKGQCCLSMIDERIRNLTSFMLEEGHTMDPQPCSRTPVFFHCLFPLAATRSWRLKTPMPTIWKQRKSIKRRQRLVKVPMLWYTEVGSFFSFTPWSHSTLTFLPGTQLATSRLVAIKKIKMGQFKDGLDWTAIREVKYLQELKHPNIIEVSYQHRILHTTILMHPL